MIMVGYASLWSAPLQNGRIIAFIKTESVYVPRAKIKKVATPAILGCYSSMSLAFHSTNPTSTLAYDHGLTSSSGIAALIGTLKTFPKASHLGLPHLALNSTGISFLDTEQSIMK